MASLEGEHRLHNHKTPQEPEPSGANVIATGGQLAIKSPKVYLGSEKGGTAACRIAWKAGPLSQAR